MVFLYLIVKSFLGLATNYGHSVLYGGWFELVSSPHFFFEILIYISLWAVLGFKWTITWKVGNSLWKHFLEVVQILNKLKDQSDWSISMYNLRIFFSFLSVSSSSTRCLPVWSLIDGTRCTSRPTPRRERQLSPSFYRRRTHLYISPVMIAAIRFCTVCILCRLRRRPRFQA